MTSVISSLSGINCRRLANRGRSYRQDACIQGFSQVELLVVLAVIILLAAILVPATYRVRAQVWNSSCVSNLRQLGAAGILMAQDHSGTLPDSRYWQNPFGEQGSIVGYLGIEVRRSGKNTFFDSIITCPAAASSQPAVDRHYNRTYSMNLYAGGSRDGIVDTKGWGEFAPFKISNIEQPAEMAFFFDGSTARGEGDYWTASPIQHVSGSTEFTYIHRDAINVVYMDGRVDAIDRNHAIEKLSVSAGNPGDIPFWSGRHQP